MEHFSLIPKPAVAIIINSLPLRAVSRLSRTCHTLTHLIWSLRETITTSLKSTTKLSLLVSFFPRCPSLTKLSLHNGSKLDAVRFNKNASAVLARACPRLRRLFVETIRFQDLLPVVLGCSQLSAFKTCYYLQTDATFFQTVGTVCAGRFRKFEVLGVDDWGSPLTTEDLSHISNCTALTHLALPTIALTDAKFESLCHRLTHLTHLNFSHPHQKTSLTDQTAFFLGFYLTNLTELHLRGNKFISASGIETIVRQCTALVKLELGQSRSATDEGLTAVGRYCHELVRIGLEGTPCSDRGVLAIAQGCPKMEDLDLTRIHRLTDIAVEAIGNNMKHLKKLSLSECSTLTNVSVEVLAHGIPGLRQVSLNQCTKLTPAVIKSFLLLTNLDRLDISVTNCCTWAALIDMKEKMKHTKIVWVPQKIRLVAVAGEARF